jgi:hypothetical protein
MSAYVNRYAQPIDRYSVGCHAGFFGGRDRDYHGNPAIGVSGKFSQSIGYFGLY